MAKNIYNTVPLRGIKGDKGDTFGGSGTGVDNHVARWDGTSAIQDSGCSIDDSGNFKMDTALASIYAINAESSASEKFIHFGQSSVATGEKNLFIGFNAGASYDPATVAVSNCLAVGYNVFHGLSSGTNERNTILGSDSGPLLNNITDITSVGAENLTLLTSGYNNVCFGSQCLTNVTSGTYNHAFGSGAGSGLATTSNANVCIGDYALGSNPPQVINLCIAIGGGAMSSGTGPMSSCIGIGLGVLRDCSADHNLAIGETAGWNISTGTRNVIIGNFAAKEITTQSDNVIIGYNAANAPTNISKSTIIGPHACQFANTWTNCCVIGSEDSCSQGTGNTFTNCCFIDCYNDNPAGGTGIIKIGNDVHSKFYIHPTSIFGVTIAGSGIPLYMDVNGQVGTTVSAMKYKENVVNLEGSEIIYKMRAVSFNIIGQKENKIGLIADEIEKIYPDMCVYSIKNPDELLTLQYDRLPILMLAEMQKLKEQNDALKAKVRKLEIKVNKDRKNFEARLKKLEDKLAA